jgi:hypothetical protein
VEIGELLQEFFDGHSLSDVYFVPKADSCIAAIGGKMAPFHTASKAPWSR